MPDTNLSNSWTMEVKVEVWILKADALKEITLGIIFQFVPLLLNKFPRMIKFTPSQLKIGSQLAYFDSGLIHLQLQSLTKNLGFLELYCQLFSYPALTTSSFLTFMSLSRSSLLSASFPSASSISLYKKLTD
ncbi:hypothetical protein ACOSQ2_004460 [Xanthoceras sorbifolium]